MEIFSAIFGKEKKKKIHREINMRRRIVIALTVVIVLFTACSKGSSGDHVDNDDDVIAPVIVITTPTNGQIFSNGNTINVTGKVTDAGGLYRGSIRITNDADGAVVREQLYEIHGFLSFNLNVSHLTAITAATDYTVTIRFEDHGSNETSASVKVKVNP